MFLFKLKLLILSLFKMMMTTVNEVNNYDETKVPDGFVFRSVSLVCFITELDE